MTSNFVTDIGDQAFELGQDTARKFVKDVVKGVPKSAKSQIIGPADAKAVAGEASDKNKKTDPTTGKPVPSKKVLSQLTQATAQLAQTKLKKIREELDKQRLKTSGPASADASARQAGPQVPTEKPKPKDDVVAQTLKASKSTGEFGKNIGG
jgi:hypothetical protein